MFGFSSLARRIEALAMPPFTGAAVAAWLCFVAFAIADRNAPLWHGNLADPDDYLYLTQALDRLNRQGWYDAFQHRMDPPRGTYIHYSHLLSGFYGLLIAPLRPFFGDTNAALIVSAIVPPVYFALFLYMLRRLAQIMVDRRWGDATAWIALLSPAMTSLFMCGHIDHHGLEVVLALAAFCCMTRMVERPSALIWAAAAGFILALGLTIGLELLAVVALFSLCLGAWAAVEGGAATRSGLVFALTLLIAGGGFLFLTRSVADIFTADIRAYSVVYVILTGCIALCFAGVAAVGDAGSVGLRCAVGGLVAVVTGGIFLRFFPDLRHGPYGGMDPALAKLIFTAAPEAWPILRADAPGPQRILPLVWPLLAMAANLFLLIHAKDRGQRWVWGMIICVSSACVALAAFYQCRFFNYALPFAALPLTGMIAHDWARIGQGMMPERCWRIARLAVLLLIVPVTAIGAGDYNDDSTPTERLAARGCDMHALAVTLDDRLGYGSRPRVIIDSINEGSELLFRTPHSVLAAPYHTDVAGNLDALRFFTADDPEQARTIARRRGAELVVICAAPAQLRGYGGDGRDIFIRQLIDGRIPDWLTPVRTAGLGDLLVFEIRE